MIEDVYEPLGEYRDVFREKFARLTREKFAELTRESGIDVDASRRQVLVVRKLRERISSAKGRRTWLGVLAAIGFTVAVAGLVVLVTVGGSNEDILPWCVLGITAGAPLGIWAFLRYGKLGETIRKLEDEERSELAVAMAQMEPLNRLYTWDVTVKLIEATVPRLQFDPYFTARRLADMKRIYDWDDSFNYGRSIIFAQSGVINGNPFLIGEYLEQDWGEKTYTGSISISWEDEEEDSEGQLRIITRHETLTASVTRPIPVYNTRKLLIYGNDAAPNLTFSREPSGLDDNDFLDGFRKWKRLRDLEKFSRNLEDDSQFTLMSNREFETWFHAKDRNNEVEFRLLFTALAQRQLMELMKDLKTGYGDDFAFVKDHKINLLYPKHLAASPIDTDPKRFRDWDYDRAALNFIGFNEKYFKDVYFALAPLLAIPLYQQTRTHEDIWRGVLGDEPSCFWEHESIANYYGEYRFRHPDCITRSILKTSVRRNAVGSSTIEVSAHGFRGIERTEYEEVLGGDGRYHTVPVDWTEYVPVTGGGEMSVSEAANPDPRFLSGYDSSSAAVFRRSIRAFISGR